MAMWRSLRVCHVVFSNMRSIPRQVMSTFSSGRFRLPVELFGPDRAMYRCQERHICCGFLSP